MSFFGLKLWKQIPQTLNFRGNSYSSLRSILQNWFPHKTGRLVNDCTVSTVDIEVFVLQYEALGLWQLLERSVNVSLPAQVQHITKREDGLEATLQSTNHLSVN